MQSHYRISPRFVYSDITAVLSSVILYLINTFALKPLFHSPFLNNYFNDILGGLLFIAYLNLLFGWFRVREQYLRKYHVIVIILLAAGTGWEYLTPLYKESTSDPWDLLAYQAGGLIYFIANKIAEKTDPGNSGT